MCLFLPCVLLVSLCLFYTSVKQPSLPLLLLIAGWLCTPVFHQAHHHTVHLPLLFSYVVVNVQASPCDNSQKFFLIAGFLVFACPLSIHEPPANPRQPTPSTQSFVTVLWSLPHHALRFHSPFAFNIQYLTEHAICVFESEPTKKVFDPLIRENHLWWSAYAWTWSGNVHKYIQYMTYWLQHCFLNRFQQWKNTQFIDFTLEQC